MPMPMPMPMPSCQIPMPMPMPILNVNINTTAQCLQLSSRTQWALSGSGSTAENSANAISAMGPVLFSKFATESPVPDEKQSGQPTAICLFSQQNNDEVDSTMVELQKCGGWCKERRQADRQAMAKSTKTQQNETKKKKKQNKTKQKWDFATHQRW